MNFISKLIQKYYLQDWIKTLTQAQTPTSSLKCSSDPFNGNYLQDIR